MTGFLIHPDFRSRLISIRARIFANPDYRSRLISIRARVVANSVKS
ncbi:hypothetical protein [Cerasibacillus terrae]|nr:hypothetical protein [Cerasibacillus terrae]